MSTNHDVREYFIELFGRIYDHHITPEAAEREMNRLLGGTTVYFQKVSANRRQRIIRALSTCPNTRTIARRYGISERHVRRLKRSPS